MLSVRLPAVLSTAGIPLYIRAFCKTSTCCKLLIVLSILPNFCDFILKTWCVSITLQYAKNNRFTPRIFPKWVSIRFEKIHKVFVPLFGGGKEMLWNIVLNMTLWVR